VDHVLPAARWHTNGTKYALVIIIDYSLKNLAGYLCIWFAQAREWQDKEDLFSLYSELTNIPPTISPVDLSATK
jgi:hypothetical protein